METPANRTDGGAMTRLQLLRERAALTRDALAELAGCGHGWVGQVELGRVRPTADARPLQRVAIVLGIERSEAATLLDEVDEAG
jgi:transcriptional regulator with XRE-family HTH domain